MIAYNYEIASSEELGLWVEISAIVEIIGGIILYFTFLSKKNEGEF